jgi:hypothetical protein
MNRTFVCLAGAAALAAACAPSSLAPVTFPAAYRMMISAVEVPTAPACARFARLEDSGFRAALCP